MPPAHQAAAAMAANIPAVPIRKPVASPAAALHGTAPPAQAEPANTGRGPGRGWEWVRRSFRP
jgi:hypothetical protein